MASALLFSSENIRNLYDNTFYKDDIKLINFRSEPDGNYSATILNVGSGPVFIWQIVIYYHGSGNAPFSVSKEISKGGFISVSTNNDKLIDSSEYGLFVSAADGIPLEHIVRYSGFFYRTKPAMNPCYGLFFFDSTSNDIERMNRHYITDGNRLVTQPARAEVVFYNQKNGSRAVKVFDALVGYLDYQKDVCKYKAP